MSWRRRPTNASCFIAPLANARRWPCRRRRTLGSPVPATFTAASTRGARRVGWYGRRAPVGRRGPRGRVRGRGRGATDPRAEVPSQCNPPVTQALAPELAQALTQEFAQEFAQGICPVTCPSLAQRLACRG